MTATPARPPPISSARRHLAAPSALGGAPRGPPLGPVLLSELLGAWPAPAAPRSALRAGAPRVRLGPGEVDERQVLGRPRLVMTGGRARGGRLGPEEVLELGERLPGARLRLRRVRLLRRLRSRLGLGLGLGLGGLGLGRPGPPGPL